MKFTELTRDEFLSFSRKQKEESFMQTAEFGDLRKDQGFDVYYLGVKDDNNEILCGTVFCANTVFLGKKQFYAPRGYLIDWHNKELLSYFTKEIVKFVRKHKGLEIIIDPNHVYRFRGRDGSILEDHPADDETLHNLLDLGYHHFGFNKYLEARQVRWAYRMELDEPYEKKKNEFSKSTRKNLEKAYSRGLTVRKGNEKDLDIMDELFKSTAVRKDFEYREADYYRQQYHWMKDLMNIYIAHLDGDAYVQCASENLKAEQANNKKILDDMSHDHVGAKLLKKKETSDKRLVRLEEDLKAAQEFQQKYPEGKDVAALLSMKSGEEYLTLSSGSLEEYRSFTPKYAMYDAHIKDAYAMGFKACNFYGISGNFEKKDNIFYGVYEFKRGWGGNVIEYIGEFSMPVNFTGKLYDWLRKIRNKSRKS